MQVKSKTNLPDLEPDETVSKDKYEAVYPYLFRSNDLNGYRIYR